jgi:hypothetical protein
VEKEELIFGQKSLLKKEEEEEEEGNHFKKKNYPFAKVGEDKHHTKFK